MKKGQELEIRITEYEFPNKGIAYVDDRKVTVKGAFRGQKVKIRIQKMKSGMAEGRLLELLERSPKETAEPVCTHFGECGGCLYQTYPYETQLAIKEQQVRRLLDGVCKDTISKDYIWEGILPSPTEYAYRNKMEFSFGDEYKAGPLALGLHKKGSFYDLVTVDDCKIADSDYNQILKLSLQHFAEYGIPYYKKMSREGTLRHLVIRQTAKSKDLLVNLVVSSQIGEGEAAHSDIENANPSRTETIDRSVNHGLTANTDAVIYNQEVETHILRMKQYLHIEEWIRKLCSLSLHGRIAGILLTINDSLADVVQADELHLLYGEDHIVEELLGLKFKITPFSFFQTNSLGAEVLYQKAREYVGDTNDQVVFDLYSGTGTIAQMLAPVAKKVIGVEIVEEAVESARMNAAYNGLDNCEFIAGDVLKVIDSITDKPDMIVLDPPRDGVHPKALPKIIRYGVDKIVYISCKPTSLARDLVTLQAEGYRMEKACCVDMFPQTSGIETVCVLGNTKRKPEDYLRVNIDVDKIHEILDKENAEKGENK